MKSVWKLTVEEYFEIVAIAKADGCLPGESLEPYLIKYMQEKGKKSSAHTELTKEEMIKEYNSHGKSVLSSEVDDKGKTKYKYYKGDK